MSFTTPGVLKANTIDATGQGTLPFLLPAGKSAAIGDVVVVLGGFGLASTPTLSVADGKTSPSNSYSVAVRADKTTNQTPHSFIAWSQLAHALTAGDTITATFGSNVNFPLGIAMATTPTASSTVTSDGTNSNTGQSTSPSSGNITTSGSDDILFGVVCTGAPQTLTNGSGWSSLFTHQANSTKALDGQYRTETGAVTRTSDGTITSADWADCILALSATVAGNTYTETGFGAIG